MVLLSVDRQSTLVGLSLRSSMYADSVGYRHAVFYVYRMETKAEIIDATVKCVGVRETGLYCL